MKPVAHSEPMSHFLKRETQALHHRLDQGGVAKVLMSQSGSREDYGAFLMASWRLHQRFGHRLSRLWQVSPPPYPLFDRKSSLQADLQDLGMSVAVTEGEAVEGDRNVLWGTAYVLEGSLLGGQMMTALLTRRWGADLPVRYLRGHGPKTMVYWSEFKRALNDYGAMTQADLPVMAAAAGEVFGFCLDVFGAPANR